MKPSKDRHKPKVLIVDDENTVTETLQVVLTMRGYNIFTADNGNTALDLLFRHKPDLVLLDLVLPGLDGLSILKRMRENNTLAKIPVIIVTVVTRDSDLADGFWRMVAGTEGFITKPFDPFEVADRVDTIISSKGLAPSPD